MSHIGFYDLAVGAKIYPPIISFFSGGGDGVVEHVGGGAGRAEAREAHCQPHTGDPVQEGSLTGHCQIAIASGCALKNSKTLSWLHTFYSSFSLKIWKTKILFPFKLGYISHFLHFAGRHFFTRVSRLLFAVLSIHR